MYLCEAVENRCVLFVISGISSPPLPVNSCMARTLHFLQLYTKIRAMQWMHATLRVKNVTAPLQCHHTVCLLLHTIRFITI